MADFMDYGPLKGSPGEEYLLSRGITLLPQKGIRFSFSEWEAEKKTYHTAMVSALTDDRMKIRYFHKTFLPIRVKKIFREETLIPGNCPTCGKTQDEPLSIKLFNCDATLGIAEGIETALSATQIYDVPTWATATAGYLRKFIAPPAVNHLIIFADNDKNGTGLAAAFECGNKNIMSNNNISKVTIKTPTEVKDFNDMLETMSHVHDWTLSGKHK